MIHTDRTDPIAANHFFDHLAIPNPRPGAGFDGLLYDRHNPDDSAAIKAHFDAYGPDCVATYVDDGDVLMLAPGFCLVNERGYFLAKEPLAEPIILHDRRAVSPLQSAAHP